MHVADIIALLVYLAALIGIGLWVSRKIKSMEEFVMPRRFGKVLMISFAFGTGTHADEAVGVSSKTFTNGLSGVWYQWLYLFCTPFYWLIAPVMKRFRAITTADIFEARYDKSVASLYTLVGMTTLLVDMGVMLKAFGSIVHGSTGFNEKWAIGLVTLVFVAYSVAGGLHAGIITDFIQGILTVLFSFILLPFVLKAVGGMAGIRASISDPEMLSMVAPGDIGVFYIAMLSLSGLIGIVTQPHILANCSSGRTEMDGRVGFMGGNMVKRFCTVAWCLIGLAAIVYFKGQEIVPDQVWGHIAKDFLNEAMPGLLGVFLATLLASLQSTANAVMICSSGLFTENVYKHFVKEKSAKHYLTVARIASVVTVAGAVIFAWRVGHVVHGLEIFWKVGLLTGIAFWLGLFWRRATVAGAWASFTAATVGWWLTTQDFFVAIADKLPGAETHRFVVEKMVDHVMTQQIYLPWAMVFYIGFGVLAGIVVSLLTRPVPEEQLENYYTLTRTPVVPGEEILKPCTVPKGSTTLARRPIFPGLKSLEFQVPNFVSMAGFIFGWVFVVGIIYGFYLITKA